MPYRQLPPRRTKVLRFCLDVLAKPGPCPVDWSFMDGGDCQRSCGRCGRSVVDIHAMDPSEAEAFLEERITRAPFLDVYVREDGRVMTEPCPAAARKKRLVRAGAALAALAAAAFVLAKR